MKFKYLLVAVIYGLVLAFALKTSAAPDVAAAGNPWQLIDIATGSATKVSLSGHDILLAHTNLLSDGTTPSTAGDYVVVMNVGETMAANLTAGKKLVIFNGGSASFRGQDCAYIAADGIIEVQIQAVGHSAKLQIIKGSLNGSQR